MNSLDDKPVGQRGRAGSRRRGEKTRSSILKATLEVIAEGGVRAVTHRAVAAKAQVNLSLTTYYFSDIFDLVSSAFQDFVELDKPRVEQAWEQVFACVYQYSASERRRKDVRESIRGRLTTIGVDYILHKLQERRAGLAVEHHFHFEALHDERLRDLYDSSCAPVLEQMTRFAALFNRHSPELDAELLTGTILNIEHNALIDAPDAIDRERMEHMLGRAIGWIMGLNEPLRVNDNEQ